MTMRDNTQHVFVKMSIRHVRSTCSKDLSPCLSHAQNQQAKAFASQ